MITTYPVYILYVFFHTEFNITPSVPCKTSFYYLTTKSSLEASERGKCHTKQAEGGGINGF